MINQERFAPERGAIIIHVAFALMALIAFTAFIIDTGVMWVSRRQAQTAADAGALAGATALMMQGATEASAMNAALHFSSLNAVWGQGNSATNVRVDFSKPGLSLPPCGEQPGCVRVDVFRNAPDRPERSGATLGSPIPTYFAHMVGIPGQRVRATATAQLAAGTAINCLLPFAIIDRWADNYDENPDATFYTNDPLLGIPGWSENDKYQPTAATGLPAGQTADVYIGPYDNNNNHTGWTVYGRPASGGSPAVPPDYGRQLVLKDGDMGDYSAGWAQRVDLPDSTGAQDYNWNILNCNMTPVGIATAAEPCAAAPGGDTTGREINGCVSVATGMAQGPTVQNGINVLVNRDPNLEWDPNAIGPFGMQGAVVDTSTGAVRMAGSMRIRPIVIFDINHYINSGCTGTTCIGKVANIVGFFIEGKCGNVDLDNGNVCENPNKDIVGRIITIPGQYVSGTGDVADNAAFIEIVRLVR